MSERATTEEYRVLLATRHSEKLHTPGALVNMTEEEARPLLSVKAIEPTRPVQQELPASDPPTIDELAAALREAIADAKGAAAEARAAAAEARGAAATAQPADEAKATETEQETAVSEEKKNGKGGK